jgi:hypothetical protein
VKSDYGRAEYLCALSVSFHFRKKILKFSLVDRSLNEIKCKFVNLTFFSFFCANFSIIRDRKGCRLKFLHRDEENRAHLKDEGKIPDFFCSENGIS